MSALRNVRYRTAPGVSDEVREQAVAFLNAHGAGIVSGEVELSLLTGGASNVNVKVVCTSGTYALRLCDPDGVRWGVDRAAAIQAQRDAAAMGLAPRIVVAEKPSGHYLSEFDPGTQLTPESLRDSVNLELVARTVGDG